MATLERTAAIELEAQIYKLLQGHNPPDTLEAILAKLRKENNFVYKHDLARSVWRMTNAGRIVVKSGRIQARD